MWGYLALYPVDGRFHHMVVVLVQPGLGVSELW